VVEAKVGDLPKGSEWLQKSDGRVTVGINTTITPELKEKGLLRDLVRQVNSLRKKQGLTIKDHIAVVYQTEHKELSQVINKYQSDLQSGTLTTIWQIGAGGEIFKVGEYTVSLSLK